MESGRERGVNRESGKEREGVNGESGKERG